MTTPVKRAPHSKLTGWRLWVGICLLAVGAIALFMGQSATWISTSIFDQKSFVSTTATILSNEDSRDALAGVIVDRALEDRPIIRQLAGAQATTLVSGLLGSDIAANLYSKVANGTYAYITSPDRKDITIDLSAIKTPLSGIVSFAENRGQNIDFNGATIPDQIVLLHADEIPDISGYIRATLILNILFWALTVTSFGTYIFLSKQGRVRRSYHVLIAVAIVASIGLLAGPFVPPVIASFVALIEVRDIVTTLTTAFLAPFATQMWIQLGIAGVCALVLSLRGYVKAGIGLLAPKRT